MHSSIGSTARWALLGALVLAGCGGGSDNPTPPADAGTSRLYIGYYAEDPLNNPEDPTVGAVMLRIPDGDGPFAGQMPFSYIGCSAGVDTGLFSGTRAGSSLDGSWSGVMDDSVNVGGTLQATHDDSDDSFGGSFTNAAGKVPVSLGPCNYHIAAKGSFKVWGDAARQPTGFAVAATASTTPTFAWTALAAGTVYTVRVFGWACLQADPGNPACFLGESVPGIGQTTSYPGTFPGAAALQLGTEYLAIVTGQNGGDGSFAGFTSVRFTPTTAGGGSDTPDPEPEPEPGDETGELTVGNLVGVTRFVPGGPAGTLHNTEGPTCTTSGALTLCSSLWTTQWSEPGSSPGSLNGTLFVQIASSSTTPPGPAPGSRLDLVTLQFYDARNPTLYRFQCGTTPTTACEALPGGLSLDPNTRTATFQDTVLPVYGAGSGSITLNGSLRY